MILYNNRIVFQEIDFSIDRWVETAAEILLEFTNHGSFYCEIHPSEEFCGWLINFHRVKIFGKKNLTASEIDSSFEQIGLWEMIVEDI
jgi:hypothetical protein